MCTHYEKNQADIDRGLMEIVEGVGWVRNEEGDIVPPDDLRSTPLHTWPKSIAPVVIQTDAGRSIASLRWGVRVEVKGATKMLTKFVTNARDDKLNGFTWRHAAAERRCLIPASAYYEPDGPEGGKWEVRFTLRERRMFFFAGLWDTDPDKTTRSFTMVTTTPNALAAPIQDRMPVILDDASAREWLGYTPLSPERLKALCQPYPAEAMQSVAQPPPQKIAKQDLSPPQGELLF